MVRRAITFLRRVIQVGLRSPPSERSRALQTFHQPRPTWCPVVLSFLVYCFNTEDIKKRKSYRKMPLIEDDLILQSDELFAEEKYKESLEVLLDHPNRDDNVEVLWRIARATYEATKEMENTTEKAALIRKGYEFIQRALELDDKHGCVHTWYAALLDTNSDQIGIWERLSQLQNVKYHIIRATECSPEDPRPWFMLGRFEFAIADMSWCLLKLMHRIVKEPPTGCYKKALECFLQAEKCYPKIDIANHLWLGKVYVVLKDIEKAKYHFVLASTGSVTNKDDKKIQEEADKFLKKL
ncbi:regulator of microtubule dynamics protein 1 [Sergentomyia squamirostris]